MIVYYKNNVGDDINFQQNDKNSRKNFVENDKDNTIVSLKNS